MFTYCECIESIGGSVVLKDWFVLEENCDPLFVEVCFAAMVAELGYGYEGEFHFRE